MESAEQGLRAGYLLPLLCEYHWVPVVMGHFPKGETYSFFPG